MVILWQDSYGKGNLRKSYSSTVGRRFPIGNAYSYTVKKGYSYLCMWMTSNWLETNKTLEGHAKKCVERFCELANKTTQQLYKVSTPCIDDHHFKEEELKSVGELSKVSSQIVLKC